VNSRSTPGAGPGDRVGDSRLTRGRSAAAARRPQQRLPFVVATAVAAGWLLVATFLVAPGQYASAHEASPETVGDVGGDPAIGIVAALIGLFTIIVIGGLAFVVHLARTHAVQRRLIAAERARSAAVQRHELLFAQARDAILLLDASGRVVEANVAAEALYGWSRAELIGMHAEDLRTPAARASMVRDWTDTRSSDGVLFETTHLRRDGTEVPVEVFSRVIEIDGKAHRQSIIRDITQRRAASDEMREQLEELRRWSAATVGRERRIIALKLEVNELLATLGRRPRYEVEADGREGDDA
jgi:PAS domain S-box-containing protein